MPGPSAAALSGRPISSLYLRLRNHRAGGPALSVIANLVAVISITLAAFWRLPGQTTETLWAEDGGVFLRQALTSQFASGIFDPYEGYLHVLPRTIAHIALRTGPIEDYAVRVAWISCLCVGLIGVAVFHLSRHSVPSTATRVLLAIIPALLPAGPLEALGNTANLHWYMLWLTVWLLVYRARNLAAKILVPVAAFVASSTEIQTVAFLPLLVWAVWRDRRRLPAAMALIVGIVMQGVTFLTFPRSTSPDAAPWDLPSVAMGWLLQGVVSLLQPSSAAVGAAWNFFGGWVLLPPIVLVCVVLWLGWNNGGASRVGTVGFLLASGMFWAAAQLINNRAFMNYAELSRDEWFHFTYLRYAVASGMFALGAAAFAAGGRQSRPEVEEQPPPRNAIERLRRYGPAAVGGAVVVVLLAGFFPSYSARSAGPVWSEQVAAARAACDADPKLETAPARVAPAGWQFEKVPIPCYRLRR